VVGDESAESLKERVKGWVELGTTGSVVYHKKQQLLNKVTRNAAVVRLSVCLSVPLLHYLIVIVQGLLGSRVVSVLDSGAEGLGSNLYLFIV